MRALQYAIEEALASLWRGRRSGLLSTATISLALFVLGAFLVVTANLQSLADQWSHGAELSVYLRDEVTPPQQQAIESALAPGDVVASREFVSKNAALARFKQTFADLASTVDTLGDNPLPASYEVRLHPTADVGETIDRLAARVRALDGVADVRYDRQWIGRLLSTVRVVRGVGVGLGLLLTIAAALTVANVVRLALYARRDELEIMHLVGAPDAFVRGPFVMEGVLQGGIGALAALAALGVVFLAVRTRLLMPLAAAVNLPSIRFLPLELCLLLVTGGMVVGCLGGIVAAWRS
ncbi:MAG TPA: ABC transporter permease [Vicinamibacterales bacterium]|nr:ABC transporter permease [Vicinamibacterales bacterium]